MQGCALHSRNEQFYCRHDFVLKTLFYIWIRRRLDKKRKSWGKEAMSRAISVVSSVQVRYLKASKYFSLPKGILDMYMKDTFHSS